MVKSDLCDYGDECIVIKGTITVESDNDNNSEKEIKKSLLRVMLHLDHAYQKLLAHL